MPSREKEETRNQAVFGKYPHFFELSDQFLFQSEKPSAHAFGVKRKSDFGSPGPAPASACRWWRACSTARNTFRPTHPAAGHRRGAQAAVRPHSATDHRITTPRSPRMAAMRRAAVELAVEGRLRPAALAQHLADGTPRAAARAQVERQRRKRIINQ